MEKGKFIVLEGGEGTGKSTQITLLADALKAQGVPVLKTREPGGTPGAEIIRNLLVTGAPQQWDPITEVLLFLAARRDHVERVIRPALQKGVWVLCDRFQDSTLAYSGFGHGLSKTLLDQLYTLVIGDFHPDLVMILSLPPEEGLKRAFMRSHHDNRIEKKGLDFHHRVHEGYRTLARCDPKRYRILDALQEPQKLHKTLTEHVMKFCQ